MKCDYRDARAYFQTRSQDTQALLQCAEFVVHFHTERLKNLRRRMTPPMADDHFFDHAHERNVDEPARGSEMAEKRDRVQTGLPVRSLTYRIASCTV